MRVLLVLLLAACGGGDTKSTTPEKAGAKAKAGAKERPARPKGDPVQLAGVLDFQGEGAVLRPCKGGEPVTLKKANGDPKRVREELGGEVDDVYVELRGLRQDDGTVAVKAFDVAMAGHDGCGTPLGATLAAFGADWRLTFDDGKASLVRKGKERVLDGFERVPEKGAAVFASGEGDAAVRFSVKRERCKDEGSSAFYPWKATLTLGAETVEGCARGDLPKAPRVGADEE